MAKFVDLGINHRGGQIAFDNVSRCQAVFDACRHIYKTRVVLQRLHTESGADCKERPPAADTGMPKGYFQGCAPEGSALKCFLNFLSVHPDDTDAATRVTSRPHQLLTLSATDRKTLEELARHYVAHLDSCSDRALLDVLYPDNREHSRLHDTEYTQPALFALEYALARLWQSWGIEPDAVLGHSVGVYVAACVVGVFSLDDGMRLIADRGRLMQALPQIGDMVAVFASERAVAETIAPYTNEVSIAAINGPELTVLSGRRETVGVVVARLTKISYRKCPVVNLVVVIKRGSYIPDLLGCVTS